MQTMLSILIQTLARLSSNHLHGLSTLPDDKQVAIGALVEVASHETLQPNAAVVAPFSLQGADIGAAGREAAMALSSNATFSASKSSQLPNVLSIELVGIACAAGDDSSSFQPCSLLRFGSIGLVLSCHQQHVAQLHSNLNFCV